MAKLLYEVLGVQENATRQEINTAYRNFLEEKRKNPGNKELESQSARMANAQKILGNEKTRRKYDAGEISEKGTRIKSVKESTYSNEQMWHFVDFLKDSKRDLVVAIEKLEGNSSGAKYEQHDKNDDWKDIVEAMEKNNTQSLNAEYNGSKKELVKLLEARIKFLDSIFDAVVFVNSETRKLHESGFQYNNDNTEKALLENVYKVAIQKRQPELESFIVSACQQLQQLTRIADDANLPEVDTSYAPGKGVEYIALRKQVVKLAEKLGDVNFGLSAEADVSERLTSEEPTPPKQETKPEVTEPPVTPPKQKTKPEVTEPPVTPSKQKTKPEVTEPPVTPPKQETKPEVTEPPVIPPKQETRPIDNKYEFRTNTQEGGREHSHEVNIQNYASLKEKYQNQRGDFLKTNILEDFRKKIQNTSTPDELDLLVKNLKKSDEYKVLKTAQRGTMQFLSKFYEVETSSMKAFEVMVEDKKQQLENPSQSIQNT